MDFNAIMSSVANIGFPAVVCIIMIWVNHEVFKQEQEALKSVREAIENNTKAITELKISMYTNEVRNHGY